MLGFFAYWRELIRLMRNAPSNPLVRAGAPWKLGKVAIFWTIFQILAPVAFVCLVSIYIYQANLPIYAPNTSIVYGNRLEESLNLSLAIVYCYSIFAFAFNLLAFSQRWNDPGRLEELFVTPMEKREMAFGSVFWAVIISFIPPAIFFLFILVITSIEGFHSLATITNGQWTGFGPISTFIQRMAFIFIAGGFVFCMMNGSLKAWLYNVKHRWVVIITGPLGGLAYVLLGMFLSFIGTFLLAESFDLDSAYLYPFFAASISVPYLIAITRNTGKLGSSLFLRPVDMDTYIEHSVLANEGLRYYRKELRKPIKRALKTHVPVPWRESFIASIIGFVLSVIVLGLQSVILDLRGLYFDLSFGFLFLAVSTIILLVVLFLKNGNHVSILSGAPVTSLKRIHLPVYLAFLAYMIIFGFKPLYENMDSGFVTLDMLFTIGTLFVYNMVFITMQSLFVALIIPAGWARYVFLTLYLAYALMLFWFADISQYADKFWGIDYSEEMAAAIMLCMVILLFNMMPIFQRLFEREIFHVPMGESNISYRESHKLAN